MTAAAEQHEFQAETSRLLHMMVHSVYSEKEIFLRELISNASDACDKLRYLALTDNALMDGDDELRIFITLDKDNKRLVISDNGIGMNKDDLISHLGTIAKSGTAAFLDAMEAGEGGAQLIGQFGVGFYSAFMVADKVEVHTRKAGEDAGWAWISDGLGAYTIEEDGDAQRGCTIILHMKDEAEEYLHKYRTDHIIRTYSDHIPVPIMLAETAGDGEVAQVNKATALWTRQKSDISDEQYTEFFHHVGGTPGDTPALTLHAKAEGVIEYSYLLYVPGQKPWDMFDPARKNSIKLYVKRVFITDDCENLLPGYLRFVKGVVDAEDLPMNISREMLQNNPVLNKIRSALTKKIIGELQKMADKKPEDFAPVWDAFGPVLKEGIYEDYEQQERLLKLARFKTTKGDSRSLSDYFADMKEGQDSVYYLVGEDGMQVDKSPQLEGFRKKGIEVLLLTDPVDGFWIQNVPAYEEKSFKSVTQGGGDLNDIKGDEAEDKKDDADKTPDGDLNLLVAALKQALEGKVEDVRISGRLTDSPVCLVASDAGADMHMERIMMRHQDFKPTTQRVMEINPDHGLVKALAGKVKADGGDAVTDAAELLLGQARIVEGEFVADPADFARRLSDMMAKAFG